MNTDIFSVAIRGMLKIRWLFFVFALMHGSAYSGEPEKPQANSGKQYATSQRGTEKLPVFIKGEIIAQKSKEESDSDREEIRQKSVMDKALVDYSFWTAFFTGLLFCVAFIQVIMFRRQLGLMRTEFNATHRPKIILRDATTEQDMGELIVIKYTLANVGDATAKIVAGAMQVHVFKGWQFDPDNLPEIENVKSDIDRITLKPGEQVKLSFTSPTLRWSGDNDTCHTFLEPEYGMFFSGQIVYEDREGTRRHTGFRRKYSSDQHRFLCVGNDPHYEYQD